MNYIFCLQPLFEVTGYIRKQQSTLPYEQNAFYVIPSLVQSIILLFFRCDEFFSIAGDQIIINEERDIIQPIKELEDIISYKSNCLWKF